MRGIGVCLASILALLRPGLADAAQLGIRYQQDGPKFAGTGTATPAAQGRSVAISADGTTAAVGAPDDINPVTGAKIGGVFVFTRVNGAWVQQGPKLIGSGAPGDAAQGHSVALSADGNTLAAGGPLDDAGTGAVWVFTRSGQNWTQQGGKLVGSGAIGLASQGFSVSLSGDGAVLVVGGPYDGRNADGRGAAWVYVRSGNSWVQDIKLVPTFNGPASGGEAGRAVTISQDGSTLLLGVPSYFSGFAVPYKRVNGVWTEEARLLPSRVVAFSDFGSSLALSPDGTVALVGMPSEEGGVGSAYVFRRALNGWRTEARLSAPFHSGSAQGYSVSLSADATVAALGAPGFEASKGGAYIFSSASGVWRQQGSILRGTGGAGVESQGTGLALSGDATTLLVGGADDNSGNGALWSFAGAFAPVAQPSHDLNGDQRSDIVWRNSNNFSVSVWLMDGAVAPSMTGLGAIPSAWSIVGQRDFDHDGKDDLLWRDSGGNVALWLMDGGTIKAWAGIGTAPQTWTVAGTGDLNGDGKADILWRDSTDGATVAWLMDGATVTSTQTISVVPNEWSVVGQADFNGDDKADILWRDTNGSIVIWFMDGAAIASSAFVGNVPLDWRIVATGDFDGNGKADIFWQDANGNTATWLMDGATVSSIVGIGGVPPQWNVVETGDFDGDGKSDVLWRDTSGNVALWFMNGASIGSMGFVGQVSNTWVIQNQNVN